MARIHTLSLAHSHTLGCGTLFGAAYWNDVDAYPDFCKLTEDPHLDQTTVSRLKTIREEKLTAIRALWGTLPKAAVQGDISINNLTDHPDGLTVFDYNNAGDEVLVSDLVLEGLLTACEMDLPPDTPPSARELLFPALLGGYLSIRSLSVAEAQAAWDIYTLYHAFWFSRIIYNENSLQKLLQQKEYDHANTLLHQMLTDLTEQDDGRFRA